MASTQAAPLAARLILEGETAGELMSSNVVSISADATIEEAVAAMTERGFSAAPVIEEAGRAVGVVSRADILIHSRERSPLRRAPEGFAERPLVRDIMTPAVFSVTPETPADQVIEQMLVLNVHQLFVVDDTQAVIGVISAHDLLRHLRPQEEHPE